MRLLRAQVKYLRDRGWTTGMQLANVVTPSHVQIVTLNYRRTEAESNHLFFCSANERLLKTAFVGIVLRQRIKYIGIVIRSIPLRPRFFHRRELF